MVTILSISEIVSDPAIRGGRPVIAGTSIRVSDLIAWHMYDDLLPIQQIAADFNLTLGQVYAALAYYHLHQDEIDAEMATNAEEARKRLAELEREGKASPIE